MNPASTLRFLRQGMWTLDNLNAKSRSRRVNRPAFRASNSTLQKFDPIAERITKLEPLKTRDPDPVLDIATVCGQLFAPVFEVIHTVSDVGFRFGTVDAVLSSEMHL